MQNCILVSSTISTGFYDCKWFLSVHTKQLIWHHSKYLQCQINFRLYWTSCNLKWQNVAIYKLQPSKINILINFITQCVSYSTVISSKKNFDILFKKTVFFCMLLSLSTFQLTLNAREFVFCSIGTVFHFQNELITCGPSRN